MLSLLILQTALLAPLPTGSAQIEVATSVGRLLVYTHKPANYVAGPVIVVCHGVLRNAKEYRDHSENMARRFGAIVVAPEFPEREFPIEQYQLGGLVRGGKVQPLASCSWNAIPELIAEVRRRENRPELPYYLIGHSGGAQFLLRLSGFVTTEARRIVIANPGTYLLPQRESSYPYGFGGLPTALSDEAWLRRYLAQPLTIYLGQLDVERDEHLNVTPPAEQQGRHRLERGLNAYRAAATLAREKGWPFNWRLVQTPDVGHDHQAMFDHEQCQSALFGSTAVTPLDVLIVAPHSDDEAIGCTGVMLQALEQKRRVGVIVVTASDGFPRAAAAVAKKSVEALEPADFFQLAATRERHTLQAMRELGIPAEQLFFLGYPDSGLSQLYRTTGEAPYRQPHTGRTSTYAIVTHDYHSHRHGRPAPYTRQALIDDLAAIIRTRRPREIYVTSEADTHADHRATHWFVRDAARAADFAGELWTYVVHGTPPNEPAGRRVVLSESVYKRKFALLESYQVGLSPVHDDLAKKYMRADEQFWPDPMFAAESK